MAAAILEVAQTLVVTVQAELGDLELTQLRADIAARVKTASVRGLVIDVSALDVLDSFASRILVGIVKVTSLRGARAVVVGIQPDVAFAMVQLGLTLDGIETALDLDEGLALLRASETSAPRGR